MRSTIALVLLGIATAGCYRPVPVARLDGLAPGGDTAAREQLVVEVPMALPEAVTLLRRALFESGLMVSRHDARGHWLVAEAGAVDDPIQRAMREIFLVASYDTGAEESTVISIGALERTLHRLGTARGTGTPQVMTNVRRLSETTGRENGAWERVRTIASWLVDHGGRAVDDGVAPRRP
ncbi:MAG: hypothetical protein MUF00_16325 [Gemmatimonadaceae bacterium]|nr:hypothetical protein [Gemmatimonadaceae bacterium]